MTQRALYLLGREGPFLNRPRQFIRFIYNRIILESAAVKCTATTALARFGANCEDLLPSVLVILERSYNYYCCRLESVIFCIPVPFTANSLYYYIILHLGCFQLVALIVSSIVEILE